MRLSSAVWLIIVLVMIMSGAGCVPSTPPEAPSSTQTWPLIWNEFDGNFYTNDLGRAQQEIPFPILLPSYIPDRQMNSRPPTIKGPLREHSNDKKVEVLILYQVGLGGTVPGNIWIRESTSLFRTDVELNPGVEILTIRGHTVRRQGSLNNPSYIFNYNTLGIDVEFEGFPIDETMKVVESMLTSP